MTSDRELEQRLRVSEERSRLIFDHVRDGILIHTPRAGRFIDVNQQACEMFGYSREEFLTLDIPAISAPQGEAMEKEAAAYAQQALAGHSLKFEWLCKRKDGESFWVEVSMGAAELGGRRVMLSTLRDITERRSEEQVRGRLAAIVESSNDAIVGETVAGVITSWNDGAETMYGYAASEAIGRSAHFIVPEAGRAELTRLFEAVARGEPVENLDTVRVRKDGSTITVAVSISPVRNPAGQVIGASTIGHDISEAKRTAAELAYRDRLLRAVTVGVASMLKAPSLEQGMLESLRLVGESLQGDRLVVVQECRGQTPPLAIRYAWQAPGFETRTVDAVADWMGLAGMSAWRARLSQGETVSAHLSTSVGPVRTMLVGLGVKSLLLAPIFVGETLWGNFSVDSCVVERGWTDIEIDTLKTLADVTGTLIARDQAESLLQNSVERFTILASAAQDGIIMIDASDCIIYWNPAAETILGYASLEAMGKHVHELLAPPRFRDKAAAGMAAFILDGRGEAIGKTRELPAIRKDGVEITIELSLAGVLRDGRWEAFGVLRDVTKKNETEREILKMARTDSLTGLANRGAFVESLQHAIAEAHRIGGAFAMFYLDLDHFKDVNDTLGHPVGDLLLEEVARRLQETVREIDTLARFGGDEFAVIGWGIKDQAAAAVVADKLLTSMDKPFQVGTHEILTSTSVGIALFGPESPTSQALLSNSDIALYRAKAEGRGVFRFFTEAMDRETRKRVTLGAEIRAALEKGQFFLLYQPQVDVRTRRIIGVEALARWNHPLQGLVGPGDFIGAAERAGLIVVLGEWVMRQACIQARSWLASGLEPGLISVNLSSLQFRAGLQASLETILAETAIPASRLELEITETVLMDASREHNDLITGLKELGFRIAIDDFGTGYSSLDYLTRFPVDRIKIAQNFVMDLAKGPGNKAVVKAAIGLALALGVEVIAEGVETVEQLEWLDAAGCHQVQGFYFSKPVTPEAFETMLRRGPIPPAATP